MSIYYASLRWDIKDAAQRKRVVGTLRKLRAQTEPIRNLKGDGKLLLATWNIRDFGGESNGGFNPRGRLVESYYYIAEILSAFDLIAVQEVNEDLGPLDRVMRLLGPQWDYIATDAFEFKGRRGERLAYLFNKSRVRFKNVAGEIVLPFGEQIPAVTQIKAQGEKVLEESGEQLQFARTPFLVSLQSEWLKVNLCTVHIYFGEDTANSAKFDRRKREIATISKHLAKRQKKDKASYILLGDFNIKNHEDVTMAALKEGGFTIPKAFSGPGTNISGDMYYDQIAVKAEEGRIEIGKAGVFPIFENVFARTQAGLAPYLEMVEADKAKDDTYKDKPTLTYFGHWRTWQMSDHNVLWSVLKTDFADNFLTLLEQ